MGMRLKAACWQRRRESSTVKDWLGRHLFVGRQRNTLGAWCGQVVKAAGSLRVRIWHLSRVSDRSMQMAGQLQGMASAGSVKAQEAFSLEDVQQEARRALVWLGFAFNGHKIGTARRSHFWVRFGNLSFPKIVFFGGLVFGAAWPLFWSRLAASFCTLFGRRGWYESNIFGLHFLGLQGAALWLCACGAWTPGLFRHY